MFGFNKLITTGRTKMKCTETNMKFITSVREVKVCEFLLHFHSWKNISARAVQQALQLSRNSSSKGNRYRHVFNLRN